MRLFRRELPKYRFRIQSMAGCEGRDCHLQPGDSLTHTGLGITILCREGGIFDVRREMTDAEMAADTEREICLKYGLPMR